MEPHDDPDLAPGELDTDATPVRTMRRDDLAAVVAIDRAATGATRHDFYRAKVERALADSSVQLSLVVELEGQVAGFLMVAFFYGEFGIPEPVAVIEAIGVHPAYRGRRVAKALLRQLAMNARALGVERIRTEVDWQQQELLTFLAHAGFAPAARLCLERRLR